MKEICCANLINLNENQNFPSSIIGSKGYLGKYTSIFKNSSNLKPSPKNEIDLKSFTRNVITYKEIPINTENIIRRQLGNPYDYYEILKKIGNGTFGTVYKVRHKGTGSIRAMKVIPKNNMMNGFSDEDIIHEINILKTLEHPNIIKLYEFFIFKKNYYLISEFCTEGDLSEKLGKLKKFPEFIVKILMFQIFNTVKYLNEKNIIHGDLKLENILIDSYLNNGDLAPSNKNSSFNSSLLEDQKIINKYFCKNIQKRVIAYTFEDLIKSFETKIKEDSNNINNKINNEKENNDLFLKLKRGKIISIIDLNQFEFGKEKNKKMKEELNKSSKNELKDFKDGTDKSSFKFFPSQENAKKADSKENMENNLKINYNKLKAKEFENNRINKPKRTSINLNSMKIKNFELKVIDFGCSKIFSEYTKNFKDTIGTLTYCSPEVLKNNYNKKCDIWSCGVLMYVLLSGQFPFFGESKEEITKKILSGKFEFNIKYFKNISNKAKDLISKCLIYDKNKRISVEEVLKHEFFSDDLNPNNIFEDEIDSKDALNSLKNYSQNSKIYQTVLAFLSHNFADKKQLNKLKKIFNKIDLNSDGKLSKEELNIAFKEAGIEMEKEELNKVIESIDFDGNGYIEYEEFIRITLPKEQLFKERYLKTAFDMFDLDKNGTISLDEIKEILGLRKISNKNLIKELLKEIPIEGKEEINYEQFKKILM